MASSSATRRNTRLMSQLRFWQSEGFTFYVMGIVLMMLALYVLTGEAVVRRAEFTAMEGRLVVVEQRLTQLETPPIVKKPWWRRR